MAQAVRGDAPVEQREIRGVEHAVAEARDRPRRQHHREARGTREREARKPKQRHSAAEHAQRAEAVDHEARERLAHAGDHEEHHHRGAHLREGEPEVAHQPGKERRQHEVEESARRVREADQRDDLRVVAQVVDDGGRGGHSGKKGWDPHCNDRTCRSNRSSVPSRTTRSRASCFGTSPPSSRTLSDFAPTVDQLAGRYSERKIDRVAASSREVSSSALPSPINWDLGSCRSGRRASSRPKPSARLRARVRRGPNRDARGCGRQG
jgi:hypothetical protein